MKFVDIWYIYFLYICELSDTHKTTIALYMLNTFPLDRRKRSVCREFRFESVVNECPCSWCILLPERVAKPVRGGFRRGIAMWILGQIGPIGLFRRRKQGGGGGIGGVRRLVPPDRGRHGVTWGLSLLLLLRVR